MYIYNSSSINFTSKKNFSAKNVNIYTSKKNVNIVEKKLYEDIINYQKNLLTKEQYLNNFTAKITNDVYKHLDKTEKKYVHDIFTVLDIAESYDSISTKYIDEIMSNLLEKKNTKSTIL